MYIACHFLRSRQHRGSRRPRTRVGHEASSSSLDRLRPLYPDEYRVPRADLIETLRRHSRPIGEHTFSSLTRVSDGCLSSKVVGELCDRKVSDAPRIREVELLEGQSSLLRTLRGYPWKDPIGARLSRLPLVSPFPSGHATISMPDFPDARPFRSHAFQFAGSTPFPTGSRTPRGKTNLPVHLLHLHFAPTTCSRSLSFVPVRAPRGTRYLLYLRTHTTVETITHG